MLLWIIVGGYISAAAAFYSYIVATAEEEPHTGTGIVIDALEWQRRRNGDGEMRKAA